MSVWDLHSIEKTEPNKYKWCIFTFCSMSHQQAKIIYIQEDENIFLAQE